MSSMQSVQSYASRTGWIMLAAIPANAGLAYALIYGAFGFPELDLLGAGLATTVINIGMCAACIWVAYACHPFRKYRVLGNFWRADWPLLGQLISIGAPISGTFLLEYGLFATAALMMGWIGTTELAAHQIALTVASILFMVPFAVAFKSLLGAQVSTGVAYGAIALIEILVFIATLIVGYIYVWRKGTFDWGLQARAEARAEAKAMAKERRAATMKVAA